MLVSTAPRTTRGGLVNDPSGLVFVSRADDGPHRAVRTASGGCPGTIALSTQAARPRAGGAIRVSAHMSRFPAGWPDGVNGRRVRVAVIIALCLGLGAGSQAAEGADAHVDRIIEIAMARGGAHAFLQRLTDSVGGRVTGSPESRAAADLLVSTLREAGFGDSGRGGTACGVARSPISRRWRRYRCIVTRC